MAIPDFKVELDDRGFALATSGEEEIFPKLILLISGLCPQKSGLGHFRQVLISILEW